MTRKKEEIGYLNVNVAMVSPAVLQMEAYHHEHVVRSNIILASFPSFSEPNECVPGEI